MRGAERVVDAFRALGETGKPVAFADGADAVSTSREDLVGIGLMAHVPDDAIDWRVENVVECNREFNDAKAGAEMTARQRHGVNQLGAELLRQIDQLRLVQALEVVG